MATARVLGVIGDGARSPFLPVDGRAPLSLVAGDSLLVVMDVRRANYALVTTHTGFRYALLVAKAWNDRAPKRFTGAETTDGTITFALPSSTFRNLRPGTWVYSVWRERISDPTERDCLVPVSTLTLMPGL